MEPSVDADHDPAATPQDGPDASTEGTDRSEPASTSGVSAPRLFGVLAICAIVVAVSIVVLLSGDDTPTAPLAVDEMAFTTVDGTSATLADYQGGPLVVNFFASWCAPCRAEMADLEAVHLAAGDDLTILGVNHDFDETSWRSFVDESGVTFPTVFQPGQEIYDQLELIGMPSTVLISADGEIVRTITGAVTAESLQQALADDLGLDQR